MYKKKKKKSKKRLERRTESEGKMRKEKRLKKGMVYQNERCHETSNKCHARTT